MDYVGGDTVTLIMHNQNSKLLKSEHSAAVDHGVKSVHHKNRFSMGEKQTQKGKVEGKGLCDLGESLSYNQVSGFESKCCINHPADDPNSSAGQRIDQGIPESASSYCPSPQNSFHSATQSIEAKESCTITESSECHSSIEKLKESGDVSQSFDFVESRKVSNTYRESTGSDVSDESSSSSISSAMYKPHKVNDARWIAIRNAQSHYGVLQLNHFRLLKQLGCGDIGKVYLSELVGTKTHFAMKVMNKAALESRKKLVRAQTEREILQSLDHPFLPTLYTHFETENHSCLLMEFCPGGDLHSLRQRQPHKCFPEHAARSVLHGL